MDTTAHLGRAVHRPRAATILILAAALSLAACGNKEPKAGQALASVNGSEITVLQLNEELQRSGATGQPETVRKQLLESLIDRQLLQNEAAKDKLDRDPKVMQAIERAKAMIIAQAYLQKRIGNQAKPTRAEIEEYFNQHPEFFTSRKQFDMRELVVASKDVTDPLKSLMDTTRSLDDVAAWLDSNKIKYGRTQVSRTSADMPPELSSKLLTMPKGQLFIIREGERSLLMQIADIKESPATLDNSVAQIEQFLVNKKNKEAAEAELKRLRADAKIDYFNKADTMAGAQPLPQQAAADARGVAGLK
ncbi:peptidyl-prolyl cis-trans isomerase, EpsD family [Duganella sp. FT92W]|uniref:peptidylprolyl isomerase n=1 Tax=Pseudoduganella rivuli TaxID=2666085 RepID=A0A7X2IQN0_9BURK|nr:EpsD family peptidyl-prolyl cis-trans isomerase [Pseudoduganella rivuli]MRV74173.1 peptidyl-prolyl cis-trans isomerase, EpsD family [Pseudoduganella rivuli]